MECNPAESADVLYVATPPLIVVIPRDALPSRNVTEPVAAAGKIAAVKVTEEPETEGFAEEASLTVVVAWVIVNVPFTKVPKL
jgi:hypothetical protein